MLLEEVEKRRFGRSTCFLCGRRLGSRNRSDEHVFPKWLQDQYALWNQHLVLLNRTRIPYRQLAIPCCYECNNQYLQPIEARMSQAVPGGPSAVEALGEHQIFLWLGKILYGVIYKEMTLKRDRSSSSQRPIVGRDILRLFHMHHFFLQSARTEIRFEGFFPASIYIFETQIPIKPELRWMTVLSTCSSLVEWGPLG